MARPKSNSKSITFRAKADTQEAIELYRSTNGLSTTEALEEMVGIAILVFLNNQYADEEATK
jgi:hypothetical protein